MPAQMKFWHSYDVFYHYKNFTTEQTKYLLGPYSHTNNSAHLDW